MSNSYRSNGRSQSIRSRLPLYQGGGETDPGFTALRAKEQLIAADVARLPLAELCRYSLFSANAKTSVSLDFPVGATCAPTATCASVCYAASPRAAATWRKSLRKRLRNLRYFGLASPAEACARMTKEVGSLRRRWAKRIKLDYLRVNGGGDLTVAVLPALNLFAACNPDVRLWIVTRRFDLATEIAELPNIYLQLSLDASTPQHLVLAAPAIVAHHSRTYLSFLRTRPEDDTLNAAIVFNEKRTDDLPYRPFTDCPAGAGQLPLDNVRGVGGTACARCRKCFSESVFTRQARLIDELVRDPDARINTDAAGTRDRT